MIASCRMSGHARGLLQAGKGSRSRAPELLCWGLARPGVRNAPRCGQVPGAWGSFLPQWGTRHFLEESGVLPSGQAAPRSATSSSACALWGFCGSPCPG